MWTDVLEESITSIFRAEIQQSKKYIVRWFFARLIFDTEDGGDTFLRNVGLHKNCIPEDSNIIIIIIIIIIAHFHLFLL
jgi:hypothetical protein